MLPRSELVVKNSPQTVCTAQVEGKQAYGRLSYLGGEVMKRLRERGKKPLTVESCGGASPITVRKARDRQKTGGVRLALDASPLYIDFRGASERFTYRDSPDQLSGA